MARSRSLVWSLLLLVLCVTLSDGGFKKSIKKAGKAAKKGGKAVGKTATQGGKAVGKTATKAGSDSGCKKKSCGTSRPFTCPSGTTFKVGRCKEKLVGAGGIHYCTCSALCDDLWDTAQSECINPGCGDNYFALVNGCGPSLGSTVETFAEFMTPFTPACNIHDMCYDTLGVTQKACDDAFYDNLLGICAFGSEGPLEPKCDIAALSMYKIVREGGSSYYASAQKWAATHCVYEVSVSQTALDELAERVQSHLDEYDDMDVEHDDEFEFSTMVILNRDVVPVAN